MGAAEVGNAKNQAPDDWAMRIAAGRGKARASVAPARQIAVILYAMCRDGTEYEPQTLRRDAIEVAAWSSHDT